MRGEIPLKELVITGGGTDKINYKLYPENLAVEVAQNLQFLVDTPKYSIPLNRSFGLDNDFIDLPQPLAIQKMITALYEAVEEYEPRVEIKEIGTKEISSTGLLVPVIRAVLKSE